MELSKHGFQRIFDRTKLHPEDVQFIVDGGLMVALGGNETREYYCFYSPFDRKAKVAVVRRRSNRTEPDKLITICETSFRFSGEVIPITHEIKARAKRLMDEWIVSQNPPKEQVLRNPITCGATHCIEKCACTPRNKECVTTKPNPPPASGILTLSVAQGQKTVFEKDYLNVPAQKVRTREQAIEHLWGELLDVRDAICDASEAALTPRVVISFQYPRQRGSGYPRYQYVLAKHDLRRM